MEGTEGVEGAEGTEGMKGTEGAEDTEGTEGMTYIKALWLDVVGSLTNQIAYMELKKAWKAQTVWKVQKM